MGVDVEELVIMAALRPDTNLQSAVGTRVYSRVPADPTFPLVTVRRLGGALTGRGVHLDRARVQYTVFSDYLAPEGTGTKKATQRIAETIREILIEAASTDFAPHGRITGSEETIAPVEVDNEANRIQISGEFFVYVHPLREAS